MTESFLECRGLVKSFGSVVAVDNVDLNLSRGHLLALLGPSGCGKTTLLRMIAGFEAPNDGAIMLAGRMISGPGNFVAPEQRKIAMVFQDFALFPHLNVGSNVAFGLPKGADKKRKVALLLELVGLQQMEKRMPHQLSGGQQQRVALARALASEPDLILLDEPFSNLDPSVRGRVRIEVKQLLQAVGITAIFVTHDQEEALSLAEEVGVMSEGRLLQVGSPAEIYAQPVSRAIGEFVGGANVLPGTVNDSVAVTELGQVPVEAGFAGAADVMFRAEGLTITEDGAPGIVESVEYFGHDQLVSVRLNSGAVVKIRLLAAPSLGPGEKVGVAVKGGAFAFPRSS